MGWWDIKAKIDVYKDVDVDVDKDFDLDADVDSNVDIKGNFATAEAAADAFGNNSFTETLSFSDATDHSSESFSESTSAVG